MHKFTKKLRNPDKEDNVEILDFLRHVPDSQELVGFIFKEIVVTCDCTYPIVVGDVMGSILGPNSVIAIDVTKWTYFSILRICTYMTSC